VTIGTVGSAGGHIPFTHMQAIVTIASYATVICPVALIGLLWRWAKRADEAEIEAVMRPPVTGTGGSKKTRIREESYRQK
jgi:hypothetical protein